MPDPFTGLLTITGIAPNPDYARTPRVQAIRARAQISCVRAACQSGDTVRGGNSRKPGTAAPATTAAVSSPAPAREHKAGFPGP
jgi:hypothetical protein